MHLIVLVEVLQEPFVDRVQVDDEEVVHGSHHGPSLRAEKCSFHSVPGRGAWPLAASRNSTVSASPKLRRGRRTRDIGRASRRKQSPLSWCPSGICSSFALVSMHFVSFRPYVEVLDDAGTSDRVRHVATESTNRPSHEAQASDWHQNGILWIAHDVPKKEPLHLGSSGVTTKSGQLSAMGGFYGNNDS